MARHRQPMFDTARRRIILAGVRVTGAAALATLAAPAALSRAAAFTEAQGDNNAAAQFLNGSCPWARFDLVASYPMPEASQGVAVDDQYVYAIASRRIGQYWKGSSERVGSWHAPEGGQIQHLNGATVADGCLYLAHSNYPAWPPSSSIEIFDTASLRPVGSCSPTGQDGALSWIDPAPDGRWYGCFARYERVSGPQTRTAPGNAGTRVVAFDDRWRVTRRWSLPAPLLARFGAMSNSGGSWGADGYLYLTGHDAAQIYVMQLPDTGTTLEWVATLGLRNTGQGIAWDRTRPGDLYAIVRSSRGDAGNRVTVNRMSANARALANRPN